MPIITMWKRHREIVVDINKILFEQLNLQGIQTPFTADEVNGSDAVQSESAQENNELKEEISSALNAQDEASSLQLNDKKESTKTNKSTNNFLSNILNTQSLMNLLSNETQKYSNEEKEIETQIQSKTEEYQKLAQEIEEKQEEYEKLVNDAESSNDESVISNVNSLGEEINSMVGDLESLKSSIGNLENTLSSKQKITNTFNSQLNSLSKVQSTLNKEAIKESAAVNSASAADALQDVNGVNETAQPQTTTLTRQKVEIKSMEEYKEILDGKFNELWGKFGDANSVVQYVKNNLSEYMDVTGDGQIDKLDLQIFDNYLKTMPKASTSDPVEQEKGREYVLGIQKFANEVKRQTYILIARTGDVYNYDLNDVENYSKLGGKPTDLRAKLNISSIAQEENWKERLLAAGFPESELRETGELYKKLNSASEFIKKNPDKANYASIAYQYQNYLKEDFAAQAASWKERQDERYELYLKDSSSYKEYMKKYPHCGMTQKEYAYATAYGRTTPEGTYTTPSDSVTTKESDLEEKYVFQMINSLRASDIDGDGKFSIDDVKNFSTEVDLDCDGTVSSSERRILEKVKTKMKENVYKTMTESTARNASNIDDIINYFDNLDISSVQTSLKADFGDRLDGIEYDISSRNQDMYGDNWRELRKDVLNDENGEIKLGKHGMGALAKNPGFYAYRMGYLDGTNFTNTSDGEFEVMLQNCGRTKLTEYYDKCTEVGAVENTYWHYINSADLSKEKLQEILNKINSASSTAQAKLSKVKALIEQKLAVMS